MLVDNNRRVSGNITGDFLFPFLVYKTSESADIDIVTIAHVGFHQGEESLHSVHNHIFLNSCFFCNLVDEVGFCHGRFGLRIGL